MDGEKPSHLIDSAKVLEKAGFKISLCTLRSCFDIVARGKSVTFFVKITSNINSIPTEHINSLKSLCNYFDAHPLIIGLKTRVGDLETGVVYSRDNIPCISLETLEQTLLYESPPLVYADRGGLFVKIEGSILRSCREKNGSSLSEFAREIGISRTTLYDYEHSKRGVDLDTALKIEKHFKMPLIKPVDIMLNDKEKVTFAVDEPKTPFEREIFEIFKKMDLTFSSTKSSPFDAVINEEPNKPKLVMLTGISNMNIRSVKKRIAVVYEISSLLEKDAFFVLDTKKDVAGIDGVPILHKKEIKKIEDSDAMLEAVFERKKEMNDELD